MCQVLSNCLLFRIKGNVPHDTYIEQGDKLTDELFYVHSQMFNN